MKSGMRHTDLDYTVPRASIHEAPECIVLSYASVPKSSVEGLAHLVRHIYLGRFVSRLQTKGSITRGFLFYL
jgi:hypothetical protein